VTLSLLLQKHTHLQSQGQCRDHARRDYAMLAKLFAVDRIKRNKISHKTLLKVQKSLSE